MSGKRGAARLSQGAYAEHNDDDLIVSGDSDDDRGSDEVRASHACAGRPYQGAQ